MSVPSAFQQLVSFVTQLPFKVKGDKAAAHLKTFEARKVTVHLLAYSTVVWQCHKGLYHWHATCRYAA